MNARAAALRQAGRERRAQGLVPRPRGRMCGGDRPRRSHDEGPGGHDPWEGMQREHWVTTDVYIDEVNVRFRASPTSFADASFFPFLYGLS